MKNLLENANELEIKGNINLEFDDKQVQTESYNDECSMSRSGKNEEGVDSEVSVSNCSNVSDTLGVLPGKTVCLLENESSLFFIDVIIYNVKLSAILDSGASKSLISSKLVNENKFDVIHDNELFGSFGNKQFQSCSKVNASMTMGDISMSPINLSVFPSSVNNAIGLVLGVDFMIKNSLVINIKDRIITKKSDDGSITKLFVDATGKILNTVRENVPCYATTDIKLTPGHVYKVPFQSACDVSEECLLVYTDEGITEKLSSKIRGYDGILDKSSGNVLILCSEPTNLKAGDCIGRVNTLISLDGEDEEMSELSPDWEKLVELDHLDNVRKTMVYDLLQAHKNVFSMNDEDIGLAAVTEHRINLNNDAPIYQPHRRFPKPLSEELERQCKELTDADIIEPSISPWSSPIVPVRKKDGTIRMCVDYRRLNSVTIPDKFPIPNLLDSIFGLSGTKFFTKLDLIRGYYQLPVEESSRPYTAFSTTRGHWQFKRLSFGLRNAPSAFQREIQAVLHSFPSNKVIVYIDDILILGSSWEEHLDLVGKVLQTLENYGIKIKASKCQWFREEVEFLGHIVSASGIGKCPKYIEKVVSFPKPGTVGELRGFLGLINFQRKYIPRCSELQKPLSCLTGGKTKKKLEWSIEMTEAFESLKTEMKNELELGYPDYSESAEKLELYVDASNVGAGAYLAQKQQGEHRIIGFASMSFTETQLKYSTIDRELAALRWGVKTFKPFLYGIEFDLFTDHQPLVHLHNMKLVCSRLVRTMQELAEYNFQIKYIPGKYNSAADALSRLNHQIPDEVTQVKTDMLPQGLTYDGPPTPGGGDSLFTSLFRSLNTLNIGKLPKNVDLLRSQLVSELLDNSTKYNVKLNRDSRKELKLMLHSGKLPTLEVLLVACRLYRVKIFVYFWAESPVIYQFREEDSQVIHLQCLSGIHFNSLVEVKNYESPNILLCSVYSATPMPLLCETGVKDLGKGSSDCEDDDVDLNGLKKLSVNKIVSNCKHSTSLPHVTVSLNDCVLCAVVDSGAELSLISESALEKMRASGTINVYDKKLCEITGFSGSKFAVQQVALIKFIVQSFEMNDYHEFAVVPDEIFPYCMLLGIDFLKRYDVTIDFFEMKFNN